MWNCFLKDCLDSYPSIQQFSFDALKILTLVIVHNKVSSMLTISAHLSQCSLTDLKRQATTALNQLLSNADSKLNKILLRCTYASSFKSVLKHNAPGSSRSFNTPYTYRDGMLIPSPQLIYIYSRLQSVRMPQRIRNDPYLFFHVDLVGSQATQLPLRWLSFPLLNIIGTVHFPLELPGLTIHLIKYLPQPMSGLKPIQLLFVLLEHCNKVPSPCEVLESVLMNMTKMAQLLNIHAWE